MATIGILIIGSLYWEDTERRNNWRRDRLVHLDEREYVRAPIRYGRLSRSRGCTYTMVFSKQLDTPNKPQNYGRAIVVPCKAPVNRVDDLINEAQHLWRAEGGKKGRISAKWGCVALLQNQADPLPDDLRTGWTTHVQEQQLYGALNSARGEASVVDEGGLLTISWPGTDNDSDLGVDGLLVTATDPTLIRGDYPSAVEIAQAWNAHEGEDYRRYVRYFRQNTDCGIRTSQDTDIAKRLRAP
ncbi:MAG: hypothetical protein F4W89_08070 [Acidobacteria bacterium]|nr:hypothetical protein [Acidobacteriota bacterium]